VPALVLQILKYAFLAILYIFVWRSVRAIYQELRPTTAARPAPSRTAPVAAPRSSPRKAKKAPHKAVVIEGDSHRGSSFDLRDELVIGRGPKCQIVLDDSYVSQMHARLFSKGDLYMVEDLGSTNGTYLNRRKVTAPTELRRGDQVKIGKTVLEMRK
jgi:pSer/pThr/pTyr-binding forkhead associated (FHA) protein